jgi:hypothetical protein
VDTDSLRTAARSIAAVRLGAGVALAAAPSTWLRWEPPAPGSSMPLLLRTVGIRDLAIGVGTLGALRSRSNGDLRRWLTVGLLSDLLDVAAGAHAARSSGARGLVSAAIAAPMVVAGFCVLVAPWWTDGQPSASR